MANRIGELRNQMPIADQEAYDQLEAARQIRLQQQMQQLPKTPIPAQQVASQLATEQATIQGQNIAAQTSARAAEAAKAEQAALEQRQMQQQQNDMIQRDLLNRRKMEQTSKLASLGRDVQEELLNNRLKFEKDARGDKFQHSRQLADYAITQAQNAEDIARYEQAFQQATETKLKAMQEAYNVFDAEERRLLASGEAELDRQSLERIRAKKKWLAEQERKAKKQSAMRRNLMGAGKAVVGGAMMYFGAGTPVSYAGASLVSSGLSDLSGGEQ